MESVIFHANLHPHQVIAANVLRPLRLKRNDLRFATRRALGQREKMAACVERTADRMYPFSFCLSLNIVVDNLTEETSYQSAYERRSICLAYRVPTSSAAKADYQARRLRLR